jgi:hypothetical protein
LWAVFSAVELALHRPQPIFMCETACQPVTAPSSLTDGACLSALSSPKSPLLCSPAWQRRPNCRRRANHPSPPCATRMAACSPTTMGHHVSCGAPWHPITAARPHRRCVCRILEPTARRRSPRVGRSASQASTTECVRWRPSSNAAHVCA